MKKLLLLLLAAALIAACESDETTTEEVADANLLEGTHWEMFTVVGDTIWLETSIDFYGGDSCTITYGLADGSINSYTYNAVVGDPSSSGYYYTTLYYTTALPSAAFDFRINVDLSTLREVDNISVRYKRVD